VKSAAERFPANLVWKTIVNNNSFVPGTQKKFASYGQPSVNTQGMVVFRARSTQAGRESGVYVRQHPKGFVEDVADLNFMVPFPNNLDSQFTEFPSIPRIAINQTNIATRGNHKPVYEYMLPDGTETRVGTNGIYAQLNGNPLITGASKLGLVPGFEHFRVPNKAVAFDVFPGSPAINDNGTIVFKGNYTEGGVGKTGVFFRELLNTPGGGNFESVLIANSDTEIPGLPPSFRSVNFGSTAPPSVADDKVVFVALDNEDNPYFGGIYLKALDKNPNLQQIAGINEGLAGTKLPGLTRIGEALSFDGRYVAFWAAWGTNTKTVRLYCPEDGNADLLAYCNGEDPNSVYDETAGKWYQEKQVHINQGILLYDLVTHSGFVVADTVSDFNDFLFWVYSGKPPGTGSDEDSEPPRWRYSAFVTVFNGKVAFKARTGILDEDNVYVEVTDGIYLRDVVLGSVIQSVAETGMDGALLDSSLPPGSMPITGLGIEREGLRGSNLAITATMANDEAGWGGVYITNVTRQKAPATGSPMDSR
jgi:hypothetical protein